MFLLFLSELPFPEQEGPVCYFYSLTRALQYHDASYQDKIPSYCFDIIRKINKQYHVFLIQHNPTVLFDDLVDEIFYEYLTDDIIASLQLEEDGSPVDTLENFMDLYSHSVAIGLLLGFKVSPDCSPTDINIDFYINCFRNYGPIPFDGEFGLSLNRSDFAKSTFNIADKTVTIHSADPGLLKNQHTILAIGCQKYPTQKIFYFDPNYPELTLAIDFKIFILKLYNPANGFLYLTEQKLIPTVDTIPDGNEPLPKRKRPYYYQEDHRLSLFSQAKDNERVLDLLLEQQKPHS